MSERAAMKQRVRGLLRHGWYKPLCALALALLPVLAVSALIIWLTRPTGVILPAEGMEIIWTFDEPMAILVQLLAMVADPSSTLIKPLVGWVPMIAILLGVYTFVGMPILVSTAGYFLSFLRGKEPRVTEVYGCFSGKYPRILGGVSYKLLWVCIWFAVSFIIPFVLVFGSVPLMAVLGLGFTTQLYGYLGILIFSAIWLISFFSTFLNRLLSYCLTFTALAAQPQLPAQRAVRLSRKLMRGCKWQVIGLIFSFALYFIPALVSAAGLVFLHFLGARLGMSAIMLQSLRTFLWVVMAANQLVWVYVAPYMAASFHAFYIERKREALMDEEVTLDDFKGKPLAGAATEIDDTEKD